MRTAKRVRRNLIYPIRAHVMREAFGMGGEAPGHAPTIVRYLSYEEFKRSYVRSGLARKRALSAAYPAFANRRYHERSRRPAQPELRQAPMTPVSVSRSTWQYPFDETRAFIKLIKRMRRTSAKRNPAHFYATKLAREPKVVRGWRITKRGSHRLLVALLPKGKAKVIKLLHPKPRNGD